MHEPVAPPARVTFGDFTLDRETGELRRAGIRVAVPDQPLRLLEILAEHPGVVVSRERLRERLWPSDTFVDFEHSLNAAVKRLRDALGDSAETPQYIETVPKRGYKFIAAVDRPASPSWNAEPRARAAWLWLGLAAAVIVVLALAGLAGRSAFSGASERTSSSQWTERRITFGPGLQTDPSWSPDGRMVAYASTDSGNWDLWIQSMAGAAPMQLTKSAASETQPSWSPDGTFIVFRVEGPEGGLFMIPALGGTPQRLSSFGTCPRWSPAGRQVLFGASDVAGHGLRQALYVAALDGRPPRRVLEREMAGFDDVFAWTWHPDAKRISFLASREARAWSVFTVPVAGGAVVETSIPADLRKATQYLAEAVWSSDGRSIVVNGWRADRTSSLWRLWVDPQTLQVQRVERLKAGGGMSEKLAIAPDGTRVAFGALNESVRLWKVPLDASLTRPTGPGTPVTEAGAWGWTSDLSPDGRTLAYEVTNIGSSRNEIRLWDLDTGQSTALASDGYQRSSVQWSRDGQWLSYIFLVADPDDVSANRNAIAIRRRDGVDDRVITTPRRQQRGLHEFVCPYDWSPRGDAVLASSDHFSAHFTLALFPIAAAPQAEKAATIVVDDPGFNVWQGNYSPDGRWLAFVATPRAEPGTGTVEVVPASGGASGAWRHVTRNGWADKPRWSPDGRRLFYTNRAHGYWNVWVVAFDPDQGRVAGDAIQVTRFERPDHMLSPDLGASEPSVGRDFLILPIMERTGSIWMLDGAAQ